MGGIAHIVDEQTRRGEALRRPTPFNAAPCASSEMKRHGGTHARAGWIGTRDGMEVDELRPGYVLVRASVCAVVQRKRLHQM